MVWRSRLNRYACDSPPHTHYIRTNNYFGTNRYSASPITEKTMLGTHAASSGDRLPTCARLRLSITKMMNTKASTKPSAICPPTPARDLRALSDNANQRQNHDGEGVGVALVFLAQVELGVVGAALNLGLDEGVQLGQRHGFGQLVGAGKVLGKQVQRGVAGGHGLQRFVLRPRERCAPAAATDATRAWSNPS